LSYILLDVFVILLLVDVNLRRRGDVVVSLCLYREFLLLVLLFCLLSFGATVVPSWEAAWQSGIGVARMNYFGVVYAGRAEIVIQAFVTFVACAHDLGVAVIADSMMSKAVVAVEAAGGRVFSVLAMLTRFRAGGMFFISETPAAPCTSGARVGCDIRISGEVSDRGEVEGFVLVQA